MNANIEGEKLQMEEQEKMQTYQRDRALKSKNPEDPYGQVAVSPMVSETL